MAIPLTPAEKHSLEIQRSSAFWKEPKELLLTLFACSLASLTQGWDQAATGNLGWPTDFGLNVDINHPAGRDIWIFSGIQSIMWFSAAILGSYLSDPISEHIGRRGALFVAAICSFSSVIAASQTQSWQALMGCRIILGLGIGGKASVVPILESEVTPSSKRGRLLVGWQVFVATGLFCGYTASYILRDDWRHQVLSGAIPAFALLVFTWASCESPRWLIIQGKYGKAFTTLVRLRKERVLAAKELCSIYYQIQAERWLFSGKRNVDEESEDLNPFVPELGRTSYLRRLMNHFSFPRIRRAAIAAMVVMLSQQLSGINIIALLATTFFSTGELRTSSPIEAQTDSYKLAIGFGAANSVFSMIAYFLVENKEEQRTVTEISTDPGDDRSEADNLSRETLPGIHGSQEHLSDGNEKITLPETVTPKRLSAIDAHVRFEQDLISSDEDTATKSIRPTSQHVEDPTVPSETCSIAADPDNHDSQSENDTLYEFKNSSTQMRGRRFLLLVSLAGGMVTLLITSLCFNIHQSSPARLPLIALFIYVFTLFYSVGAGAIPFLYCAEVRTSLLPTSPQCSIKPPSSSWPPTLLFYPLIHPLFLSDSRTRTNPYHPGLPQRRPRNRHVMVDLLELLGRGPLIPLRPHRHQLGPRQAPRHLRRLQRPRLHPRLVPRPLHQPDRHPRRHVLHLRPQAAPARQGAGQAPSARQSRLGAQDHVVDGVGEWAGG